MRRFLFLAVGTIAAAGALVVAACTSTATADREPITDDSGPRIDGGLVGPAEGGAYDAGTPQGPEPDCTTYCEQVMGSCTGPHAQYASASQCHELCQRLPAGDAGDTSQLASLASFAREFAAKRQMLPDNWRDDGLDDGQFDAENVHLPHGAPSRGGARG